MKNLTLFALCMLVLGSGTVMAASWSPPIRIAIFENSPFNAFTLFNVPGQSVFDVPALPINDDFHWPGHQGSWDVTGPYSATGPSVTSLDFIVNFTEDGKTSFQFYAGVYEDAQLLNYVEFEWFAHFYPDGSPEMQWTYLSQLPPPNSAPEPSLVLLLGIGLGAVGLMMWRREV